MNPKSSKFKSNDKVRIAKHKNIFSKGYTEHWSKEIFLIDSVLKTNPWRYRVGQKKTHPNFKSLHFTNRD